MLTCGFVLSKKKLWEGESILLSRGASLRKGGAGGEGREQPVWDYQTKFRVAGDTGLRYADVSGDYNPHHLYKITAIPMGFNRPIAHGMWTLASALHELAACQVVAPNVYPIRVECDFKRPLFMPSEVTFGYRKSGEKELRFGVYCKNNQEPHIVCTFRQGE